MNGQSIRQGEWISQPVRLSLILLVSRIIQLASSSEKVSQPVRPSLTLLVSRIVSQATSQLINRLRMYLG